MNTPKSVAYGWAALIVATGVGYYWAKGENEKRWKDQRARGLRSNDKLDWKDKVAQDAEGGAGTPPANAAATGATTLAGGQAGK